MTSVRSILVLLIAVSNCTVALGAEESLEPRVYQTPFGESLQYRIYLPEDLDPQQKYPLLLFFHGAGERGDDNRRQLAHGVKSIMSYVRKNDEPPILIAPQCPAEMQWVNTPWDADSHTMPEFPSYPMRLSIELLQQTIEEQPVDANRIYVTGLSMGGFGAWDIIQRKPELFAAAVPICGGGDARLAASIKEIPIWTFHGGRDDVVQTKRSRVMIEAIKKAGGSPRYTEYENMGHGVWGRAYRDDEVLKWLFEQEKKRSE